MTSVKVAVRVRPLNNREHDLDCKFIIQMDGKKTTIVNPKVSDHATEGDVGREGMRLKEFTFDFSFWSVEKLDSKYVSQQQTGSGKTYSMMGNPGDEGLIPRICKELFSNMTDQTTSYRTEVSYLEIYNEKVRDLLKHHPHNKPVHNLRVREHPKQGPYVQDLSKYIVNNFEDIEELMHRGNAVRTTASTNMNDAKFTEDMPCEMSSKIHLVDLAGSERADASGATGQRLKEGASINKSLVTLGTVISVLAEISEKSRHGRNVFIPYRDSVLTWLLKDSLGGNSRTIMVATISPADVNYGETLSTLRYANRAKNIINRPTVNEDPNVKVIRELREEIERLKTMLGGNIDNISTPKVQEKLHENEARIKVLTEEWAGKWSEAASILKDQTLALRKEGLGVVLDSALPHLIGIDDDILSSTTVGRTDADEPPDIVIAGIDVEEEHCVIEHYNGEVTLYPVNDALCAVILLGRTNMFRFNHPAEAAKMRQELKNSGLSLSRTSLLSKSMSDLYRSSENLALMGAGFELEYMNSKEQEELEEKRLQINLLEKRYYKSEEDRETEQLIMEKALEEKEQQLATLQDEIKKLKDQINEKQSDLQDSAKQMFSLQEQLRNLEEEEKQLINETNKATEELKQTLDQEDKDLHISRTKMEDETNNKISSLTKEINSSKHLLDTETETLHTLQQNLTSHKEKLLSDNLELKKQLDEIQIEKDKYVKLWTEQSQKDKEKWNNNLAEISEENKKIEEAWKDLKEYEQKHKARKQSMDINNEKNREKLKKEEQEIESARTLLKLEEEKVVAKEKDILDKIENEMDEWEKRKKVELNKYDFKQLCCIKEADHAVGVMAEELENKKNLISKNKKLITDYEKEISELKDDCEKKIVLLNKNQQSICQKKNNLRQEISESEKKVQESLTELNANIVLVQKHREEEVAKIHEERERLLELISQSSVAVGCCTESDLDLVIAESISEESRDIEKKIKEVEELQKIVAQAQSDLEEKQRMFDEQRDMQLDKIEFEKLKLQEMEHQDR
ncbi:hypothetical protein KUTeg_013319 [Tegillarca granosa]|uniref:Kinesin motor domain-containing protein n=1 Tax=Tegillarca granosa TaxID=220873 RepID=A0ABQ9EYH5_TEGGR|nr:hypothetical protein KUTeg_013319 [Tegillarca granosa]